jgi:predicted RNA-binding protein (virulence factor B family)
MVTGTIYNILDDGFFLFTTDRYIGFLHRSEAPANRRLDFGEQLTCRVAHIREDGRLNLSLRPQKENALVTDAAGFVRPDAETWRTDAVL